MATDRSRTFVVDTDASRGAGSLVEAVKRARFGDRVIFADSMEIELQQSLTLANHGVTIDGTVHNVILTQADDLPGTLVRMQANGCDLRNLNLWPITAAQSRSNNSKDCVTITGDSCVVSKCSGFFAADEACNVWGGRDTMIKDCVWAYGVLGHSKVHHRCGPLLKGTGWFRRNIVAHFDYRSPSIPGGSSSWIVRDLIIYNCRGHILLKDSGATAWIIDVLAINGPDTMPRDAIIRNRRGNTVLNYGNIESTWGAKTTKGFAKPVEISSTRTAGAGAWNAGPRYQNRNVRELKRDIVMRAGRIIDHASEIWTKGDDVK